MVSASTSKTSRSGAESVAHPTASKSAKLPASSSLAGEKRPARRMVERWVELGYPLAPNRRLAAIRPVERWRSRGWGARGGRLCPSRIPARRRGPRRPRRSSGQGTADGLYEVHGPAERHEQRLHEHRRRKTL